MMTFDDADDDDEVQEKKEKKEKKKKKDKERDRDDDEKKEKKKKKDKEKERDEDKEDQGAAAAAEEEARPVSCWEGLSADDMVYNMLLCAIKIKVKKEDLPCETSKFLKDFMQPTLHEVLSRMPAHTHPHARARRARATAFRARATALGDKRWEDGMTWGTRAHWLHVYVAAELKRHKLKRDS